MRRRIYAAFRAGKCFNALSACWRRGSGALGKMLAPPLSIAGHLAG